MKSHKALSHSSTRPQPIELISLQLPPTREINSLRIFRSVDKQTDEPRVIRAIKWKGERALNFARNANRTNVLLRCRASIMGSITSGPSVSLGGRGRPLIFEAQLHLTRGVEKVRKKSERFDTPRICPPPPSLYCIQELLIALCKLTNESECVGDLLQNVCSRGL